MFFSFTTVTCSLLTFFLFFCSFSFSSFSHSATPLRVSCAESVFYLTSIVSYFLPLFHCRFWPWSGWATLICLKSRQEAAAYSCQNNDPVVGTFPPVPPLLNSPIYFRISLASFFSVVINYFVLIMLLPYFLLLPLLFTQWHSWLSHCATSRNFVGSIPDGVTGIFRWHNPSGKTVTLGLSQPLTENNTRNISWG
jgi:hypothetical protein